MEDLISKCSCGKSIKHSFLSHPQMVSYFRNKRSECVAESSHQEIDELLDVLDRSDVIYHRIRSKCWKELGKILDKDVIQK